LSKIFILLTKSKLICNMKRVILIMCMLISGLGFSYAQSAEFMETAKKTMELQNTRGTMVETMRLQYQNMVDAGQFQVDDVKAMSEEIVDVLMDKITELQIKLFYENYTLDELKELNKFLASPIGQKNIKLAPKFAAAGMQSVQEPEMLQKIQQIAIKHIKQ